MSSLIKLTDAWMTRSQFQMPGKSSLYPSESSVTWKDMYGDKRVEGTCLRAAWLRVTGWAEKEGQVLKTEPYGEWIFALGKAVEIILVEQWKQMGIWVANNVKFFDQKHNISGEIDCVLQLPESKPFLVEVKSFYGYAATKQLCGNKSTHPSPKTSQLLQTLIYVDQFKEYFDYAKMIYYARDSANRAEFDISLIEDASKPDRGILHRPTIDGVVDSRFYLEDIYDRFDLLNQYIIANEMPPCDFEREYSAETVEKLHKQGEIAKTTYEKWQKKPNQNPIGDWRCRSYCKYRDFCYKK